MSRRRRGGGSRTTALWLLAVVVSFAVGGLLGSRLGSRPAPSPAEPASRRPLEELPQPVAESGATEAVPVRPDLPPGRGARVAVVIDDLGRSLEEVEQLAGLPGPVTYSVLPFEHSTARVVRAIRERGGQLLCHLPMEPAGSANPGPGALNGRMSKAELARATAVALDAVEGAVGANHHMGSSLSTDARSMQVVLHEVGRRGLFYLDSKTSAESVGYRVGQELGVPSLERQIFLDPDRDSEAIRRQFHRLLEVAARRGAAIAIGHPYPETLRVLADEMPRALAAGYEFVDLASLIDG